MGGQAWCQFSRQWRPPPHAELRTCPSLPLINTSRLLQSNSSFSLPNFLLQIPPVGAFALHDNPPVRKSKPGEISHFLRPHNPFRIWFNNNPNFKRGRAIAKISILNSHPKMPEIKKRSAPLGLAFLPFDIVWVIYHTLRLSVMIYGVNPSRKHYLLDDVLE